jgi:toxin HigB-1
MPHSTASCAALESAQCDFSHSLQEFSIEQAYGNSVHSYMIIRSVRHWGLLRLIEDDDSRELRNDLVRRLRNILAVLIAAVDMDGVTGPPGWRVHQLKGDRAGTWSISVRAIGG